MENIVKRYNKGKFIFGKVLEVKDNKEVFQKVCEKCLGNGNLSHLNNVDNGICYKCMGTGKGTIIKKLEVLTDLEIKNDIINRELDKKRKRNEFIPDFIIERFNQYTLEELVKLYNI